MSPSSMLCPHLPHQRQLWDKEASLSLCLSSYVSLSLSLYVSLSLSLSLSFFGQVMSPHPSDQMSQRSQASWVTFWRCSLNVFVFVIVSSSRWSNVWNVTSLWDRSLTVLSKCMCLCHCLCPCICLCHCVFLVRSCLLITLIKCLKGHKSLGLLSERVL